MAQHITAQRLELPNLDEAISSVDVMFDGRRVWSVDVRELSRAHDRVVVDWPESLAPHLVGTTTIEILDSMSGRTLAKQEVSFDAADTRTRIVDEAGMELAVNKWGRLAPTLETLGGEVQQLIISRSLELVAQLRALGLRPFIVGGTLLGAVREGQLLPHDDDADIAYLSEHTDPADVAIEAFRVGHELEGLGYELRRHSATHMQLLFRDPMGEVTHYIDVFAAFFTPDGMINQPFHVRGPMTPQQMLPFSDVLISNELFPAPADPDHWLRINYDENWRVPIPGYEIVTPEPTRRRFDGWFGGFNFQREFWDEWHRDQSATVRDGRWESGARWIEAQDLESPVLLDVGAGAGLLGARLESSARRVIACDYSPAALQRARNAGRETAKVNLNRLNSLKLPQELGIRASFDFAANHLFEQLSRQARENAMRLARMALRSGGTAVATCYGAPASEIDDLDPTTWHLERHELRTLAREYGLTVVFADLDPEPGEAPRLPYGARFKLGTTPYRKKEPSMKHRLKRLLMRARSGGTRSELEALRARVGELETELDEVRRDNLRVAELIDLAEQALTPGSHPGGETRS